MDLRKRTFSGVRWTALSSFGIAILQFLQIVVLARLLKPEDFGIFAIVLAITAILQIFSDAGVSNAIIHFQDISQSKLSSLFWLNVLVSVFLALLMASLSPWVASYFDAPELTYLLVLAAMALVASSFGQQLRVVAQKNLRFATLARIEIFAALAGFIAAVSVALCEGGVFALITGSLTTAIIGTVLVWVWLSEGWRPRILFKLDEIHEFLKFGAFMIGDRLFGTFNTQIDILIGGRMLSAQTLGFYSLSRDLNLRIISVINPIITRVGLPVMAKVQNEVPRLKNIYLKTIRMTSSINFPVYVAMGTFAPEIVVLFLGSQWESAIPLLRILAFWALIRSTGNPVGILLIAMGRVDLSFKFNMAWSCILLPTVWFGSQYGGQGIALAITGLALIGYIPNWYFLVRPLCEAKLGEYSSQLAVPFALSLTAGFFGYFAADAFVFPLTRLFVGSLTIAISYVLLSFFFNAEWFRAITELLNVRTDKSADI